MSKKINTTSIGLFIVTGLSLGVAGLILFSSSKLFSVRHVRILYFNGSLNGLSEGAPVKYRGVTIGSVQRLMIRFNQATNDYAMPVLISLDEKLLHQRVGKDSMEFFTDRSMDAAIGEGLRASLQTESLVTGVLYVGLDVDANLPPPVYHQLEKVYPEMPTEPTQVQQLFNNLASLDIHKLQTNLDGLISRLDTTLGEMKMNDINSGVTNLLISVNRLISDPDITNGLAALRPTLDQYRALGAKVTGELDPVSERITNTLAQADSTLAQIRGAGEGLRILLTPDSPARAALDRALDQLAGASQSVAALADFLKQNPNALITGRELPKTKP